MLGAEARNGFVAELNIACIDRNSMSKLLHTHENLNKPGSRSADQSRSAAEQLVVRDWPQESRRSYCY